VQVIIVDDNMYYASMRHEVYQLVRQFSAGYAQVALDCPTRTASSRNTGRPPAQRVATHVVERMAGRIELPAPQKRTWERNSILLDASLPAEPLNSTGTTEDPDGGGGDVAGVAGGVAGGGAITPSPLPPPPFLPTTNRAESSPHHLPRIWQVIADALTHPTAPIAPVDLAAAAADRAKIAANMVHQFDVVSCTLSIF
jgi:hypothetical protein